MLMAVCNPSLRQIWLESWLHFWHCVQWQWWTHRPHD